MSDETTRLLERQAKDDPRARLKLTMDRLRCKSGVVWVFVASPTRIINIGGGVSVAANEPSVPSGPSNAVEVVLHGYATGGEARLDGGEVEPTDKCAWVLACLDVSDAIFGIEIPPQSRDCALELMDLGSGKLIGAGQHIRTSGASVSVI